MRTPEEILKAQVGDLVVRNAVLQSENEGLQEKLLEVSRMVPPEMLRPTAAGVMPGPNGVELSTGGTPPEDPAWTPGK